MKIDEKWLKRAAVWPVAGGVVVALAMIFGRCYNLPLAWCALIVILVGAALDLTGEYLKGRRERRQLLTAKPLAHTHLVKLLGSYAVPSSPRSELDEAADDGGLLALLFLLCGMRIPDDKLAEVVVQLRLIAREARKEGRRAAILAAVDDLEGRTPFNDWATEGLPPAPDAN